MDELLTRSKWIYVTDEESEKGKPRLTLMRWADKVLFNRKNNTLCITFNFIFWESLLLIKQYKSLA